ncbi:phospholipid-transporting ATPase IF isoform X2 [Phlebotomus argentipes]|uniref:phospholipid-transporting ATPase IF isoform X2 n=1 Tax=Phlebotomus argentipes TaxID=94469 RepID=UPI0028931E04|nr:phospholipid-transporting ATPase IF isoform X2 [Phlebotomus argentipes]
MSLSVGTVYTRPWFWKKGNRVAVHGDSLTIHIGGDLSDKKAFAKRKNRIKSTKYTLITFLPQNLLEQFRRIANFYFLVMTTIALIIDSPVTPLTSIIPLVFVISVTAMKQGYEDYLRHRADNMVNYSLVTVMRNGVEMDIKCQNIVPGDLVKVVRDCDVPCDLVLLKSSDPHAKCYITTANLDGESNLKTLTIPRGLPTVDIDRLNSLGIIECEYPITDLYSFNGRIELSEAMVSQRTSVVPDLDVANSNVLPLMAENLLLRGSRVKNTEWVIGCAVYTGQMTKLALNSKLTKYKMSSSEKFINKFLVFFLILLISIVTVSYFLKRFYDMHREERNIYLGDPVPNYQVSQFLQDYFSFLILFNYLIPISLYVTIEVHKFLGSFYLEWDLELYDVATNQPCIVNTSDLNEELGQVEILFSDKTGTLTKNEMIFQHCSINGKKFMQKRTGLLEEGKHLLLKLPEFKEDVFGFFEALSVCHTVQVAGCEDADVEPSHDMPMIQSDETDNINSSAFTLGDNFTDISEEREESPILEMNGGNGETINHGVNGDLNPLLNRQPTDTDQHFLGYSKTLHHLLPSRPSSEHLPKVASLIFEGKQRPYSVVGMDNASFTNMHEFTFTPQPLSRPNSHVDLKRTISTDAEVHQKTHRRTQSYNVPPNKANASASVVRTPSKVSRQSSVRSIISQLNSRESYAAPQHTEAAKIERNESMYRRGVIQSVIEQLNYQASSPDEKALVEACAKVGFVYTGDDDDVVTVKIKKSVFRGGKARNVDTLDSVKRIFKADNSTIMKFKRLHVLEFTSDRKRMSVIVRDQKGQIWLYTKGAESHVLPLCDNTPRQLISVTQSHINDFAKLGLRTLTVARRRISNSEYIAFCNEITQANNSLTDRKALVENCQQKIERNLELLGATAVEDALQDNVRDTLEALRHAGIKVWVLTGDKVETALNIALSCGHIPDNAIKHFIVECQSAEKLEEQLSVFENELNRYKDEVFALLIDGGSLAFALSDFPERFRDLSVRCRAVLCCRLSPLQKCEVVHLMKTVAGNPITASIGDGANDVSMIQEAHVGLGIVGKEGRQAARCADYAFANFSMVRRMLLVHGHYFSQRLSLLVLYFFYKNLVFMMIQLYFQTNSMFSSQSVYDSLFLTLYNVVYTALPILVISITEKVYPMDKLMNEPPLYKNNVRNKRLQWKYFCGWILLAVYHSSIIYVSGYLMWVNNPVIFTTPHNVNFFCYGTFMIHNVVILVNLKLWLTSMYQSYWFIFSIWLSIFGFVLTTFIYNLLNLDLFDGDMLHVYSNLLSSLTFWLLCIVVVVAALIPDFTIKALQALNVNCGSIFPGPKAANNTKSRCTFFEMTRL